MSPSFALPIGLLSAAAYLNARLNIDHDVNLAWAGAKQLLSCTWRETRDRLNLFYTLESNATSRGTAKRTCLGFEGETWTYQEVYDIVLQYGCWLREKHYVKPKEIVAMDMMNSPQFIFLWLGLWSIGACPAFINYNLRGDPLTHCIKISNARLLFVDEALEQFFTPTINDCVIASDMNGAQKPLQIVSLTSQINREIAAVKATRPSDELRQGVSRHDMALLIYTSGTTGMPKAAIISWGKVSLGSGITPSWYGMKPNDNFYTVSASLPLYCSSLIRVVHATVPYVCRSTWLLRFLGGWSDFCPRPQI